ncbi:MAG: hypothetical protein WCW52_07260 [Elusimicrobiales bacterium]|jgi:hypothetical protein
MKNKILKTVLLPCLFPLIPAAARAQVPAAAGFSTAAVTVEQAYHPSNTRDPLKISTVFGDEHAPTARAASAELARSTFSVYNLTLTGILEDSRSKEAMLRDLSTGVVYFLRGGKLLDSRKKQLPGVSGVVKGKQVILMTEDKKIHQLTLHEKD